MDIRKLFAKKEGQRPYKTAAELLEGMAAHGPLLFKVDALGNKIYKGIDVVTEKKNGHLTVRMGRDIFCPETIYEEYSWQDGSPAGVTE